MTKQAILVAMRELRQMNADAEKNYYDEKLLDEKFYNWISNKL